MDAPILMKQENKAGGGGGGGAGSIAFTTESAPGGLYSTPATTGVDTSIAAPLMATVTSSRAGTTPEGAGYTWNDTHFNETEGIIAVFDFDYDQVNAQPLRQPARPQRARAHTMPARLHRSSISTGA
jgi:hypothetical protein